MVTNLGLDQAKLGLDYQLDNLKVVSCFISSTDVHSLVDQRVARVWNCVNISSSLNQKFHDCIIACSQSPFNGNFFASFLVLDKDSFSVDTSTFVNHCSYLLSFLSINHFEQDSVTISISMINIISEVKNQVEGSESILVIVGKGMKSTKELLLLIDSGFENKFGRKCINEVLQEFMEFNYVL